MGIYICSILEEFKQNILILNLIQKRIVIKKVQENDESTTAPAIPGLYWFDWLAAFSLSLYWHTVTITSHESNYKLEKHCATLFTYRLSPQGPLFYLFNIYCFFCIAIILILYTILESVDAVLNITDLSKITQNLCLTITHLAGIIKVRFS